MGLAGQTRFKHTHTDVLSVVLIDLPHLPARYVSIKNAVETPCGLITYRVKLELRSMNKASLLVL